MNNVKFEGIMPALITPFCEDNKTINEEVAREFIDYLLTQMDFIYLVVPARVWLWAERNVK